MKTMKSMVMLLVGVLTLSVAGCAKSGVEVTPEDRAARVLTVVKRVGLIVEQAQAWELDLYAAGVISSSDHLNIQKGFAVAATSVEQAVLELPRIVSAEDRKALLLRIGDAVLAISARLQLMADENIRRLAALLEAGRLLLAESAAGQ